MTEVEGGLKLRDFRVVETVDLPNDELREGGTVEVPSGGSRSVLRFRTDADRIKIYGYGLNDQQDCIFEHFLDDDMATTTESPLGPIGDPFSFHEMYGHPISAEDIIEIRVTNNGDTAKEFAGRMFIREVVIGEEREFNIQRGNL